MRIAVLIIGLVLMLGLFFQSLTINVLGDVANDEDISGAGAIGVFVALLWLIAIAVVIPKPRISVGIFVAGGLLALLGGTTTEFSDLIIWAVISFFLAVLSYFGYRGKRKLELKEATRDAQLQQSLAAQQQMAAQMQAWQQQQQQSSQWQNPPSSQQ